MRAVSGRGPVIGRLRLRFGIFQNLQAAMPFGHNGLPRRFGLYIQSYHRLLNFSISNIFNFKFFNWNVLILFVRDGPFLKSYDDFECYNF